ncbi:unnamed protein product, partial [Gulo gulo]
MGPRPELAVTHILLSGAGVHLHSPVHLGLVGLCSP